MLLYLEVIIINDYDDTEILGKPCKQSQSINHQSINQSINQKRIRVTKVTNVTARPLCTFLVYYYSLWGFIVMRRCENYLFKFLIFFSLYGQIHWMLRMSLKNWQIPVGMQAGWRDGIVRQIAKDIFQQNMSNIWRSLCHVRGRLWLVTILCILFAADTERNCCENFTQLEKFGELLKCFGCETV